MAIRHANILEGQTAIRQLLQRTRRVAVLGIKPESRSYRPAYYVAEYLRDAGYEVIPVPVYYPEVEEILGVRVFRSLVEIEGDVDVVNVFRKAADVPRHIPELVQKRPGAVWFQPGTGDDAAALELAEAGIPVVHGLCLMSEHRRLLR